MACQPLYCPTCRDLVDHLVEQVEEGDVAWCQTCRRVHLVADPQRVPSRQPPPLPPCGE